MEIEQRFGGVVVEVGEIVALVERRQDLGTESFENFHALAQPRGREMFARDGGMRRELPFNSSWIAIFQVDSRADPGCANALATVCARTDDARTPSRRALP